PLFPPRHQRAGGDIEHGPRPPVPRNPGRRTENPPAWHHAIKLPRVKTKGRRSDAAQLILINFPISAEITVTTLFSILPCQILLPSLAARTWANLLSSIV